MFANKDELNNFRKMLQEHVGSSRETIYWSCCYNSPAYKSATQQAML
jgi:hypothetical protein